MRLHFFVAGGRGLTTYTSPDGFPEGQHSRRPLKSPPRASWREVFRGLAYKRPRLKGGRGAQRQPFRQTPSVEFNRRGQARSKIPLLGRSKNTATRRRRHRDNDRELLLFKLPTGGKFKLSSVPALSPAGGAAWGPPLAGFGNRLGAAGRLLLPNALNPICVSHPSGKIL